jgi:hypothetical protein
VSSGQSSLNSSWDGCGWLCVMSLSVQFIVSAVDSAWALRSLGR